MKVISMKKCTISQRLKKIMNLMGIKQIDILNKAQPICEKLCIKMGSNDLSQYVTGKVEPSQKKLSVLAEALDTNEVWLMGYDVPIDKNFKGFIYDDNFKKFIFKFDNADNKIKELETSTGVKISYSPEKPLTQEDYMVINQLILNELKAQEEDKK